MKKNIRNISNVRVLCVTEDAQIKELLEKDLVSEFKNYHFFNKKEFLASKNLLSYDILVIDMDINLDSSEELLLIDNKKIASIPIIFLSSTDSEEIVERAINLKAYTFLMKPFNTKNLKLSIIMCINQTKRADKIEFNNGVYFDEYRDQFFNKNGVSIDFTKLEKNLLKLLISRKYEITEYGMIKDIVWKDKAMSIYTMRNIVNKIRQKTYYEIIKNHSSRGYTIDFKESK